MNKETQEDAAELVTFGGEEYLFYKSFPVDVALLRGTVADENGNISFMHEGIINEGLSVASATRNSGGIVIVQVEYLAKAESLNPPLRHGGTARRCAEPGCGHQLRRGQHFG